MNKGKGIIYKIKDDKVLHYYIRLERTVKIKDDKTGKEKEYNIFIIKTNGSSPEAKLVSIEECFTCKLDLSAYLGKKLNLGIDCDNKKLTSVEYYEA